jgi:hypothetical protein
MRELVLSLITFSPDNPNNPDILITLWPDNPKALLTLTLGVVSQTGVGCESESDWGGTLPNNPKLSYNPNNPNDPNTLITL